MQHCFSWSLPKEVGAVRVLESDANALFGSELGQLPDGTSGVLLAWTSGGLSGGTSGGLGTSPNGRAACLCYLENAQGHNTANRERPRVENG